MVNNEKTKPSGKLQSILLLVVVCFIVGGLPQVSAFNWSDDIISYWNLDESSGTVIDSLGVNNGANTGTTTGVTGVVNTSYDFERDDNNNQIQIADSVSLKPTDALSYSLWLTGEDMTNNPRIFSKEGSGQGYNFYWESNILYGGIEGAACSSAFVPTPGQWYFIAMT